MKKVLVVIGLGLLFGFLVSAPLQAQEDNADEAVKKTQNMMKSRSEREKLIDTPEAKKTSNDVKDLAGNAANEDAIYALAADVLEKIKVQSKGDPIKMQELLQEAQRNPAAFANQWSDSDKQKLKSLSEQIDKDKKKDYHAP
jgi:uncharacterized membrane protein YgaE (UPF0421/DUF939 family)